MKPPRTVVATAAALFLLVCGVAAQTINGAGATFPYPI